MLFSAFCFDGPSGNCCTQATAVGKSVLAQAEAASPIAWSRLDPAEIDIANSAARLGSEWLANPPTSPCSADLLALPSGKSLAQAVAASGSLAAHCKAMVRYRFSRRGPGLSSSAAAAAAAGSLLAH